MAEPTKVVTDPGQEEAASVEAGMGLDDTPLEDHMEPAADVDTEPEPGAAEAAATAGEPPDGAFDPAAFAEQYDLDADSYKNCETEADALTLLARTHQHFSKKYGDHANELGLLRQRNAELEAAWSATEQVPAADAGGVRPDTPAAPQMTDEQREHYYELHDRDPLAAYNFVQEIVAASKPATGNAGDLEQDVVTRVTRQIEFKQEFKAFEAAHPDWRRREWEMDAVCENLGFEPPYEVMYTLADMVVTDAAGYMEVAGMLRRGLSYEEAQIVRGHKTKTAPKDVTAEADAEAERARTAGPTSRGRGPAPTPVVITGADISQDEDIGAEW